MSRLGPAVVVLSLALAASHVHVGVTDSAARREPRRRDRIAAVADHPARRIVETKAQVVAGVSAFSAAGVSIADERVVVYDQTALVIARLARTPFFIVRAQSVFRKAINAFLSRADKSSPKRWPFTARVFRPYPM